MDPKRLSYSLSESHLSTSLFRISPLRGFLLPLLLTVIFLFGNVSLQADISSFERSLGGFSDDTLHLERISFVPRSDGMGYVIRFHQSARLDSFSLIQPASDLIQLEFFHSNIDTLGIQFPTYNEDVQEVRLLSLIHI